jgi:hypothetical protein
MSSEPLIYQIGDSSSPSFAQQGQVDWVAFGNTTWNITAGILKRFASADIQPVTYGAALALGCQFKLPPKGRENISQALVKLTGNNVFQNALYLGFGHQSFVKLISSSEPGLRCVALCSCLAEVHGLDVSGYILSELWVMSNYPKEYEPSHEQFCKPCKNL